MSPSIIDWLRERLTFWRKRKVVVKPKREVVEREVVKAKKVRRRKRKHIKKRIRIKRRAKTELRAKKRVKPKRRIRRVKPKTAPKTRKAKLRLIKRQLKRPRRKPRIKKRKKKIIKKVKPVAPKALPKLPRPTKIPTLPEPEPIKKLKIKEKKVVKKLPKEIVKELIAADIMAKKPIVVRVEDPLSYVVRLFADKKISGAPVVHGNNFVGIISESDIIKFIGVKDLLSIDSFGLKKLSEFKVSEAMHRRPIFVNEYTKLSEAADLMNKHDITRLPVLNDRREIVGIVSRSDIVRAVSKELLIRILRKRPGIEILKIKVETDVDNILKIVEKKGSIDIDEIEKKLMIPEEKIEEWGKILEKHDLLELYYPSFGKAKLRKKLK